MKKRKNVLLGIAGALLAISGSCHWLLVRKTPATSVAIIGGADGPTSVFVAGKLGEGNIALTIASGIAFTIAMLLTIYAIVKRKQKE